MNFGILFDELRYFIDKFSLLTPDIEKNIFNFLFIDTNIWVRQRRTRIESKGS